MMKISIECLEHHAYNMRVNSLKSTTVAGSGHPTSALSAADLVSVLFFYAMKYNPEDPYDPDNDRFILSKGHAAPVLYAAWHEVGVITEQELLTLRQFNSVLEGHPTPRFAYNDAATGSLGIGLSIGLGMALSTRLSKHNFYTYVLLGDSEMSEGSVWEAIEIAAFYKVNNLIAIVDLNGLGQSTETMDDRDAHKHAAKWAAFGWHTIIINGHDIKAITDALDKAKQTKDKPTVIVAKTHKGYGLKNIEDKQGYHGKAFSSEQLPELLNELEKRFSKVAHIKCGKHKILECRFKKPEVKPVEMAKPEYNFGDKIATRKAYGQALAALADVSNSIVSLDAEVKNSTYAEIFEKKEPSHFIQCFIAEQNMIGMAVGLALRGYVTFSSTFGSFITRAHDQIRMAAIGQVALKIAGSHCGVSVGEDGPSQMALEDIAQMRALPESIVLYPCDAVSTHALVNSMANYNNGISYLRLTRGQTPVIYSNSEEFTIGGCKVLKQSDNDQACVIAAGITVFESLKAYEELKLENIFVSIIDLYSVKPLDSKTLISQAYKANKRIVTVEDHYIQGGLGEAVCYALKDNLKDDCIAIEVLAVRQLSRSGKPEELLAYHKIDAAAIIDSVHRITGKISK